MRDALEAVGYIVVFILITLIGLYAVIYAMTEGFTQTI